MGPEEEEDLGSGIRLPTRSRCSPLSLLLEGDIILWDEDKSDVDTVLGGGEVFEAEGGLNFRGGEGCRMRDPLPESPVRELARLLPMT